MGAKEDAWHRGSNYCRNCEYYGESKKCPCMRCYHPDNMRQEQIGIVYMKSPDYRNWHNKCDLFKTKETP